MDLLNRYYTVILKEQTRKLKQYVRQKEKADKTIQDLALTPAHTAQRYWQAVNKSELCIKEIQKLVDEMNYLDEIYEWKEKLHQDRFNFIDEKVFNLVN